MSLQAIMALASLHICASLNEPSLLAETSTEVLRAGSNSQMASIASLSFFRYWLDRCRSLHQLGGKLAVDMDTIVLGT